MAKGLIKSTVVCNLVLFFSYLPALGQNLVEMSFFPTGGIVFSVKAQGDHLYLAEVGGSSSLFKSVDISNPAQPLALDSFFTAGFITNFALNGNYAYLSMADNEFGLRILDISDPANIREVHFFEGTESSGTFLLGETLFVPDGGGLSVYDISRPDTLVFSWFVDTNQFGDGISAFATAGLTELTVFTSGLYLIDQASHSLLGVLPAPRIGLGVVATDRNAFFTDEVNGLVSVDITDPESPVALDTLSGSAELGVGLALAENLVYWCAGRQGLRVVDISRPGKLQEKASFASSQIFAIRAAFADTLICLATGDYPEIGGIKNGVYILKNDLVTSVAEQASAEPGDFALARNYPNPFNPGTTIRYALPRTSEVELAVFNLLGQRVVTLVKGKQTRGSHSISWNGRNREGLPVSSGLYIYRLRAGDFTQVRRMALLR